MSDSNMERKTAADFDQELLILFDAYVHGAIDRRGFLNKASKFAVGGVTAAMLLDQLSPNFAAAQQVTPDDKRLKTESVEYPSPKGYGENARAIWSGRPPRRVSCPAFSSFTRIAD